MSCKPISGICWWYEKLNGYGCDIVETTVFKGWYMRICMQHAEPTQKQPTMPPAWRNVAHVRGASGQRDQHAAIVSEICAEFDCKQLVGDRTCLGATPGNFPLPTYQSIFIGLSRCVGQVHVTQRILGTFIEMTF